MTDKEKRELKDGVISIFKRFNILDPTATIGGLRDDILRYIDSLQEELVNKDFEMALAEMIDKAQKCVVDPLVVAEQWKDELVKLAKREEPVSNPIDFEKELYKAFGQVKDFTIGIAIAKRFYDMGIKHNEPISEELEIAARKYATNEYLWQYGHECWDAPIKDFKAGAKWQKEQFETNRLAACDRQTEEEAECEQDFVMGIIEKEHRQPTFDDAIKYGMRLKEEEIKEALLSEVLPCFMHGGEADEVVAKLDEVLNQKK